MRYLVIHWIDEAALNAEGTEFESGVEAWSAEMDRRGVRVAGGAAAVGQRGRDGAQTRR